VVGGNPKGNPNPDIWKYGFGSRPREVDDEYRARAKGVPKWTKERCITRINDILDRLDKILLESEKVESKPNKLKLENIRDLRIMMNTLLEYMKYLYPPIQTSVNVNVEYENLIDRIIRKAKEKKIKEEGYVIIEDEKK